MEPLPSMFHLFKNWGDQRFRWLHPGDGSLIGSTYRWVQWWYGTGGATLGAFVLVLSFPLAQQGSHRDGHLVKNLGHGNTVDERNPANQLRLVVYPIIYRFYRVLYIPVGAGCLNHQQSCMPKSSKSVYYLILFGGKDSWRFLRLVTHINPAAG